MTGMHCYPNTFCKLLVLVIQWMQLKPLYLFKYGLYSSYDQQASVSL